VGQAQRTQEFFFLGLFSLIDAIIERPLVEVLKEMHLSDDIKAALLGEANPCCDVYEGVLAYEKGEWERFSLQAGRLGVNEEEVPQLYAEAVQWAQQSFRGAATAE
jgi:EAL and modified HD-GYP domain-containing signal transduction protein